MEPQTLDQFTRRLLYAYHGHVPRAEDDQLACHACGVDFKTASMAEIMRATRRHAIAEAFRRAATACDTIGIPSNGDTPYHRGARDCAAAVRALGPLPNA
jgi:hypothetical protein